MANRARLQSHRAGVWFHSSSFWRACGAIVRRLFSLFVVSPRPVTKNELFGACADCSPLFRSISLSKSEFVYIRVVGHKSPLVRPYIGPFKVLQRGEKHFVLDMNGKNDSVSIDRLKSAFLLNVRQQEFPTSAANSDDSVSKPKETLTFPDSPVQIVKNHSVPISKQDSASLVTKPRFRKRGGPPRAEQARRRKSVHAWCSPPPNPLPPLTTTRSGRLIHPPRL